MIQLMATADAVVLARDTPGDEETVEFAQWLIANCPAPPRASTLGCRKYLNKSWRAQAGRSKIAGHCFKIQKKRRLF